MRDVKQKTCVNLHNLRMTAIHGLAAYTGEFDNLVPLATGAIIPPGTAVHVCGGYPSHAPGDRTITFKPDNGVPVINTFTVLDGYVFGDFGGGMGNHDAAMSLDPPPGGLPLFVGGAPRQVNLQPYSELPGQTLVTLGGTPGAIRLKTWDGSYLEYGQALTNPPAQSTYAEALLPGEATINIAFQGAGVASNYHHSFSLPVTAYDFKILFKAADGTATNALAVGNWDKNLGTFFFNEVMFDIGRSDFINFEDDRFQIFLSDHRRTEATLDITLTQAGSIADSRMVTLYRQTDGTYLSTNLLLVADIEDRDDAVLTYMRAPPGINQRMFTVALDDTLSVSYSHSGVTLLSTTTVGVDVKDITVYFAVMTTNGIPCITDQDRVDRDMKMTRSCYAQANIRVNTVRLPDFPAPSALGPTFTNWTVCIAEYQYKLTQEAKNIFDAAGSTPQNICFVYVPWIHPYPVDYEWVFNMAGMSVMPNLYEADAANKDYLRNAFISAKVDDLFTPPHELGHGLKVEHTDAPSLWHLMTGKGTTINTPQASKRLSKGHIKTMRDENEGVFQ